jgi:hypothetical protein
MTDWTLYDELAKKMDEIREKYPRLVDPEVTLRRKIVESGRTFDDLGVSMREAALAMGRMAKAMDQSNPDGAHRPGKLLYSERTTWLLRIRHRVEDLVWRLSSETVLYRLFGTHPALLRFYVLLFAFLAILFAILFLV